MAVGDPQLLGWLADSLSSGLVAIDLCGRLVFANPAALRILGPAAGEAGDWLGRDFREVLLAHPPLVALLEDALDGRERPSRAELVLRAAEPGPLTIGFTVVSIRDPEGAVRGAAVQFRDLAPFEQLDEQARLRDRLAALGETVAGLAHELRNPLAAIQVLADLLRRRLPADGQDRELVDGILLQLQSTEGVLAETLAFVRPAAPAPREVDPVALLDGCLDRACARVPFPGKIERAYARALPPLIADADQLRAALTDVLVNALEAMAECDDGRELRLALGIEAERRAGLQAAVRVEDRGLPAAAPPRIRHEIVFTIADTGPGVPEALRDRIFHPFFSTKDGGGGIGLAKAQKVVGGHGGAIELESREGRGATFRVRLPAGGDPE
jgi:nitrogen-specific signal transduction histidine kinase